MRSWPDRFKGAIGQTSPSPRDIEVSSARGIYIYDYHGQAYMDAISGICVSHLGHGQDAVIQAIKDQTDRYLHSMVYGEHVQRPQVLLAEALIASLPTDINQCYFTSTGAEAIECGVKLAKRVTGRPDIVSIRGGYHGNSHLALSLNDNPYYSEAYRPLVPGIRHLDPLLGDVSAIDERVAGVVLEVIQAGSGCRVVEEYLLKKIRRQCDQVGALLIIDEIQTGFHRTGPLWGFESSGIQPDIICLAKALGGGLPLGAVLSNAEHLRQFTRDPMLGHISTFGGHPLSCAAGMAAWKVLQETITEEMIDEKERLIRAQLTHPSILEVRGKGLLLAVQLDKEKDPQDVIRNARSQGLLIDGFLHDSTSIRLSPPLSITESEIKDLSDRFLLSL